MEDNNVSLETSSDNKTEDISNDSEIKKKKEPLLRGVKRRKKHRKRRKKRKKVAKEKPIKEKPKKKKNPYYTYKKTRRTNSKCYTSIGFKERTARNIFRDCTDILPNLSYISNDRILLKKHIIFMKKCRHATYHFLKGEVDVIFKTFSEFKRYDVISDRFYFLMNICYNKDHRLYPYFGGKGIKISEEFLDAEKFCIWCLKNNLTYPSNTYVTYLQRKDKSKDYSPDNCFVITEKDVHENKYLNITLAKLLLQKKYNEGHADKVNYMIAYSRYFQYDMDFDDAVYLPRLYKSSLYDFLPINFHKSVADENSCTLSAFLTRYKTLHDGKVPIDPYSFLDKDVSVTEVAKRYGVPPEDLERHKKKTEKRENRTNDIYRYFEDKAKELYNFDLNSPENSVYKNCNENDVYSH
jgi:hypothetical protein